MPGQEQVSVIVVGAGMAGLTVAYELQQAGVAVTVLEARERVGGRTWSDRSLGIPVDLGGAWIHGTVDNPMMPLVERFGVRFALTDFYNEQGDHNMAVFDADGSPIDPALYIESLERVEATFEWARQRTIGEDVSLDVIIQEGMNDGNSYTDLEQRLFNYAAYSRLQLIEATDLNTLSWRLKDEYIELKGGDQLMLDGYNSLTDRLAEGLDIQTGVVVQQVEQEADAVRLVTDRGSYRAALVVIAVPLGVLKAGSITFAPALPAEKQAAIERIGMGVFEKLVLKFPDRFWPQAQQIFIYVSERQGYFPAWLNLAHYHDAPVLVVHHGGTMAQALKRLEDYSLVEAATRVLRRMFKGAVPEPEAYLRTAWQQDPFARGSYSFDQVGGQAGDRLALARPAGNRLFFAGEATHPQLFATVHGAHSSGLRAAGEVLER